MKKSFENPASYTDGDFEGHAVTPKELEEGKKAIGGTKSQQDSLADMLAYSRKAGDKMLEENVKGRILEEYLGGKPEAKEVSKTLSFEQLKSWWKEKELYQYFDLEKAVSEEEKYWQGIHGHDFKLDRSKISKDAKLLKAIEAGVKNGCINGIRSHAVAENLSEDERKMTEAEQAFHAVLEKSGMEIWDGDSWTKTKLQERLKRYLPVQCSDFNVESLQKDYVAEFKRVSAVKGKAPLQQPGKVEIFFTDTRQDIPADQKLVNLDGEILENPHSFIKAIANKISFANPEDEVVMAGRMYAEDKKYIARETWEWLMAIVDHRDKKTDPPVSAANAVSLGDSLSLNSGHADNSSSGFRLRVRL